MLRAAAKEAAVALNELEEPFCAPAGVFGISAEHAAWQRPGIKQPLQQCKGLCVQLCAAPGMLSLKHCHVLRCVSATRQAPGSELAAIDAKPAAAGLALAKLHVLTSAACLQETSQPAPPQQAQPVQQQQAAADTGFPPMQQGEVERVHGLFQQMDGDQDGFLQVSHLWDPLGGGGGSTVETSIPLPIGGLCPDPLACCSGCGAAPELVGSAGPA